MRRVGRHILSTVLLASYVLLAVGGEALHLLPEFHAHTCPTLLRDQCDSGQPHGHSHGHCCHHHHHGPQPQADHEHDSGHCPHPPHDHENCQFCKFYALGKSYAFAPPAASTERIEPFAVCESRPTLPGRFFTRFRSRAPPIG